MDDPRRRDFGEVGKRSEDRKKEIRELCKEKREKKAKSKQSKPAHDAAMGSASASASSSTETTTSPNPNPTKKQHLEETHWNIFF